MRSTEEDHDSTGTQSSGSDSPDASKNIDRGVTADDRSSTKPKHIVFGAIVLAVLCVIAVISETRAFTDVGERNIGHADEANLALVARNIAEGRGAVTDAVWLMHGGGPSGPKLTHPEGYWSIYASGLISIAFQVFGANLQSLFLVPSLLKIAVAFLGFGWVLYLTRQTFVATVCGAILLLDGSMREAVCGLSDMYLVAFVFASATALILAVHLRSKLFWLLCGALTGIAIGMEPSGVILLGLIPVLLVMVPHRGHALLNSWPFLVGLVLSLWPLADHNYKAAGTVFWPDAAIMGSAGLQADLNRPFDSFTWNEETSHAWNAAAYDPETTAGTTSRFDRAAVRVYVMNLAGTVVEFLRGTIVPLWIIPFLFVAAVAWIKTRFRERFSCNSPEELLVAVALILSIGCGFLATMIHCETRYYLFMLPFFVIIAVTQAVRFSLWLIVAPLLLVLGLAIPSYLFSSRALDTSEIAAFRVCDETLPQNARVMTQNPWEFAFHTRRPGIVVPYNSKDSVIREVAQRFELTHFVVIEQDVRHPELDHLNRGEFPPFIQKMYQSDDVVIGKFVFDRSDEKISRAAQD